MSVRRLAASAILAAAALTLSACGPDETTASDQTSAAPSADSSAAATSPAPSSTEAEAGQSGAPDAKPTHNSQPTKAADCTAKAKQPGHKVINAVSAWGDPNRIGANETKFVCGPDVPNDGYYVATVSSPDAYEFAAGATAQLLIGVKAQDVTIDVLLQHINTCTQNPNSTKPYSCYGNMYDITLNASGKITQIRDLYHP